MSADASGWSVKRHVSKEVILAREEHLHTVLEGKPTILVTVEELNESVALGFSSGVVPVVTEEVE